MRNKKAKERIKEQGRCKRWRVRVGRHWRAERIEICGPQYPEDLLSDLDQKLHNLKRRLVERRRQRQEVPLLFGIAAA
jgi:hypothetical protein